MRKNTLVKMDFKELETNATEQDVNVTVIEDIRTGTEYVELREYANRHGISESKIRRQIKIASGIRNRPLFVKVAGKYFISDELLTRNLQRPLSAKNELKDGYRTFLRQTNWHVFACLNFSRNLSLETVRKKIELFHKKSCANFPRDNVKIFYALHLNDDRYGYHVHFLVSFNFPETYTDFKRYSQRYFESHSKKQLSDLYITKFDSTEDGIGYILRKITQVPDGYDLLIQD
jgi:hypothetical protein